MDFDQDAVFFAVTPQGQADEDRRMREDILRIAAREAEIETNRVADELEQAEKEMKRKN